MVFAPDDPRLGNVLVSLLDVSELKRAEEALRQSEARVRLSEERYRHVVDLIQEAIWIHRDGNIAFANPAAAKLFGAPTPDALLGTPIFSLIHPTTASAPSNARASRWRKVDRSRSSTCG